MKALVSKEWVQKAMEYLAGRQPGEGVWFEIAGTNNNAIMRLEKGYGWEGEVCLKTGAVARDDDHLVQHFFHYAASMEEMREWLLDAGNADAVTASLQELSDRVDEGFD